MSIRIDDSVKAAIAIKTARTALGLNQVQFSELIGVAKTTLARVETLESQVKLDLYMECMRVFEKYGITINIQSDIVITIGPEGQEKVIETLADEANRRVDRKKRHYFDETIRGMIVK